MKHLKIFFVLFLTLYTLFAHGQTLTADYMVGLVQCPDSACFSPKILSKGFAFKNVERLKNQTDYGFLSRYVCNAQGDSCDVLLYLTIGKTPVFKSLWLLLPDDDVIPLLQQFVKSGFEKFTPTANNAIPKLNTYYQNKTLNMVLVDEVSPDFFSHSFLLVQTTDFNPAYNY